MTESTMLGWNLDGSILDGCSLCGAPEKLGKFCMLAMRPLKHELLWTQHNLPGILSHPTKQLLISDRIL